jgi:hypothetical protein
MPVEVSKVIDAHLYPELIQTGGLARALKSILDEISAGLDVRGLDEPQLLAYAKVRSGQRFSQVMLANKEHAFSVDFWNQGVLYGHGWTRTLREAALAIECFQARHTNVEMLSVQYPWFVPSYEAGVHQNGPEAFIADAWECLFRWLSTSEPVDSPIRRLLPLVMEARGRSALRQLLPFTSMDRLCFSRTTGYPYTADCPIARPIGENRFQVLAHSVALGEGDAVKASDLLIANLPDGCGPAQHGTAED